WPRPRPSTAASSAASRDSPPGGSPCAANATRGGGSSSRRSPSGSTARAWSSSRLHRISGMATIALPLRRVVIARTSTAIPLIVAGALVPIPAGPFDTLWHSMFGRDVDIWSPPHIAGIAGGAIGLLGWLAATAPGVFPIDERLRRLLRLFTLGNLIAISVFAL